MNKQETQKALKLIVTAISCLLGLATYALIVIICTYLVVAAFTNVIFGLFSWPWSWPIAFGVWLTIVFLKLVFNGFISNNKGRSGESKD